MLNATQIEMNKQEFLNLIERLSSSRNNPHDDWPALIDYLTNSDFFTAPASTMFHANYAGGLCEHSLNVYHTMIDLIEVYRKQVPDLLPFTWESVAIVSLFHDISKTNLYEKTFKNVKKYWDGNNATLSEYNKKDEGGYFKWEAVSSYTKKDLLESFTYGNHEESSVLILQEYLALSKDEIIAILHHTGSINDDFNLSKQFSFVYEKYPLASLLHLADTFATFLIEKTEK